MSKGWPFSIKSSEEYLKAGSFTPDDSGWNVTDVGAYLDDEENVLVIEAEEPLEGDKVWLLVAKTHLSIKIADGDQIKWTPRKMQFTQNLGRTWEGVQKLGPPIRDKRPDFKRSFDFMEELENI